VPDATMILFQGFLATPALSRPGQMAAEKFTFPLITHESRVLFPVGGRGLT
jgi:hypothetical protein